jgi:hypothetical protein
MFDVSASAPNIWNECLMLEYSRFRSCENVKVRDGRSNACPEIGVKLDQRIWYYMTQVSREAVEHRYVSACIVRFLHI